MRWHRAGFRRYWRWKSRRLGGRPQIDADLRALIRRMSVDNPLWGAPRIHGELLKLGFEVAQSSDKADADRIARDEEHEFMGFALSLPFSFATLAPISRVGDNRSAE